MTDFAVWLKNLDGGQDPDLQELQDFAAAHSPEWPYSSNDVGDYVPVITGNAPDATRNSLLATLARGYAAWTVTEAPAASSSRASRIGAAILTHLSGVMLAVFGALAALIIAYGIFHGDFLSALAQPAQARGFITFLFAFCTIAIFLLVAVATFWMHKDEVEARYAKAKDLLTLIIGIFGTILGFYYGSLNADANALNLTNTTPSATATAGETISITASVLGGTAPVTYDLTWNDPSGAVNTNELAIKDKPVVGSAIAQPVTLPGSIGKPLPLNYLLIVHDAKGNRAQLASVVAVQPKIPPK